MERVGAPHLLIGGVLEMRVKQIWLKGNQRRPEAGRGGALEDAWQPEQDIRGVVGEVAGV